jgi:ribose/xylose/arabinose/galactoside ABC-type transport system permease subunit
VERKLNRFVTENNSILILVLIAAFAIIFVPGFTNIRSMTSFVREISLYGMIAVGLSVIMMAGAIDLSVGYQAGFSAVITVAVLNATGSIWLAVLCALVTGVLTGAVNGLIVTKLSISPLIATIATNYIYKGLCFAGTNKESLRSKFPDLKVLYDYKIFGLSWLTPCVIAFVVALVVLSLLLRNTRMGSNIYVTGGNAEAGELAGINTKRTLFLTYILCGLCCAVSGVFMASWSNAAFYTQGGGRDIFAISACVIGGLKMVGGSGTMTKVLIGIVVMRLVSMIMNLSAVSPSWVNFISGALLIIVLIVERYTKVQKAV